MEDLELHQQTLSNSPVQPTSSLPLVTYELFREQISVNFLAGPFSLLYLLSGWQSHVCPEFESVLDTAVLAQRCYRVYFLRSRGSIPQAMFADFFLLMAFAVAYASFSGGVAQMPVTPRCSPEGQATSVRSRHRYRDDRSRD